MAACRVLCVSRMLFRMSLAVDVFVDNKHIDSCGSMLPHRTKNSTTNVVIQQNSRKLLMNDILMSETCWAHKKWNKITSVIKLVFYSSTTNMNLWTSL